MFGTQIAQQESSDLAGIGYYIHFGAGPALLILLSTGLADLVLIAVEEHRWPIDIKTDLAY